MYSEDQHSQHQYNQQGKSISCLAYQPQQQQQGDNRSEYAITTTYVGGSQDSMNKAEDPVEKAQNDLKILQKANKSLQEQIYQMQINPQECIFPERDQIISKINYLKDQNAKLRRLADQCKLPMYSEIKRKSTAIGSRPNPNDENTRDARDSTRNSLRNSINNSTSRPSLRNSGTARTVLSEISQNSNISDKNDRASTCLNFEQYRAEMNDQMQEIDPIQRLAQNSEEEELTRQRLTEQIQFLVAKTEIFEEQMEQIKKGQSKAGRRIPKLSQQDQQELLKVEEYKRKLLRLLNKLKSRECAMNQTVRSYRKLYEDTIKQLQQSMQTLKYLQQAKVDQQIEKKYAEVLELEERLQLINAQLQEMDQAKWLEKIYKQLSLILRRLGVQLPKIGNIKDAIDEACYILMEQHLSLKKDSQARLLLIKQYHDDEKDNNQKLVQALKAKQQILSKKLNDYKMGYKK